MGRYCEKPVMSRSKWSSFAKHRCFRLAGHAGRCHEFPYLDHLASVAPLVARKIIRDATMTTGAAWKSEDAGPNRVLRWAMLLGDKELAKHGIRMTELKPQVIAKLREKAATYDDCMSVAMKLAWLAYGMVNAPDPDDNVRRYLETLFGRIAPGTTLCTVCLSKMDFADFAKARRGKAEIETAHRNPRLHTVDNVGFGHRSCNIAQGDKTVDEFYDWIETILRRAREPGARVA